MKQVIVMILVMVIPGLMSSDGIPCFRISNPHDFLFYFYFTFIFPRKERTLTGYDLVIQKTQEGLTENTKHKNLSEFQGKLA